MTQIVNIISSTLSTSIALISASGFLPYISPAHAKRKFRLAASGNLSYTYPMEQIIALTSLFGVMILQVIIPPIPAEGIVILAARQYGILTTTIVSSTGLIAGSAAAYGIGRFIKHAFARAFSREKVVLVLERFREYGSAILWIRILPYNPSDIISYAAGVAGIAPGKYMLITVIVAPVRCFTLAWLGKSVSSYGTLFLTLAILLLSAIIAHIIVYARHKSRKK